MAARGDAESTSGETNDPPRAGFDARTLNGLLGWRRSRPTRPSTGEATEESPVWRGFVDSFSFLPGVVAWGAIFGTAAVVAGLPRLPAVGMSAIVYSGTAQLAILKILSLPLISIFATSLLLSLRFLPMSLALNHRLVLPRWLRLLVAVTIVDAGFALSSARRAGPDGLARYLIGCWISSYGGWMTGTVLGVAFGPVIPPGWMHTVEGFTVVLFVVLTAELCTSWRLAAGAGLGAAIGLFLARFVPIGPAMGVAALAAAAMSMPRVRRAA